MLGWRKRNDGFEWRDYVRTTILVRRKHRRDRVGEARKAAVENLKAAGQRGAVAGAEGAKASAAGPSMPVSRARCWALRGPRPSGAARRTMDTRAPCSASPGAKVAGGKLRAGVPIAGSWLQRFGAALIAGIAYVWAVLRTVGGIVADYTAPVLAARRPHAAPAEHSACRCSLRAPSRWRAVSSAPSPTALSATP